MLSQRIATWIEHTPDLKCLREFRHASIYIVGGWIRDAIMQQDIPENADLDIVIQGVNLDEIIHTLEPYGRVNLAGKTFGVIKFKPHHSTLGKEIDIALPRTEQSTGTLGRYKDVTVNADPELTIHDDLSRRDLTINAIAYDIRTAEVIDPFDGKSDLSRKQVKAVRDPHQRIAEDKTRMLRAIRFAVRFGFTIEENTKQAIADYATDLAPEKDIVPVEMIAREIITTVTHDQYRAMALFKEFNILQIIFSLTPDGEDERYLQKLRARPLSSPESFLALLAHIAGETSGVFPALRLSSAPNFNQKKANWLLIHLTQILTIAEPKFLDPITLANMTALSPEQGQWGSELIEITRLINPKKAQQLSIADTSFGKRVTALRGNHQWLTGADLSPYLAKDEQKWIGDLLRRAHNIQLSHESAQ